jgi:hypothetical protein
MNSKFATALEKRLNGISDRTLNIIAFWVSVALQVAAYWVMITYFMDVFLFIVIYGPMILMALFMLCGSWYFFLKGMFSGYGPKRKIQG